MNLKQIGKNIQAHRKEQKMTQAELAKRCQISVIHVSHIENGSVAMSLKTLLSVCRVLNTTPNDILLGEYLYPNLEDMLFQESSPQLNFEDKVLLQQIFCYLKERQKK